MQGDLFDPPVDGGTGFNITRCGLCVHRGGAVDAPEGNCSPMGPRRWDDPTCEWRFGREQLRLSILKRPKTT